MHYVYKFVNDSNVLYVGKSDAKDFKRIEQHGRKGDNISEEAWGELNACDIYYVELPTNVMTDVVESELIRRYKPKYNIRKKEMWDGLEFPEPVWKEYRVNGVIKIKRKEKTRNYEYYDKSVEEIYNSNVVEALKQQLLNMFSVNRSLIKYIEKITDGSIYIRCGKAYFVDKWGKRTTLEYDEN